ncbi:GNAT family N-acetyltransferase [Paenibacillus senegalimassiliensis]|uniref:GNAT family N-acetyltransferase n=1 Tax=Paenibacillus senegalimassiliensis TaxID=1737426 RepID=UPI000A9AC1B0|nr:GNAT family N-acetyltransferase [Paenibacillus senegalimassiliensis]
MNMQDEKFERVYAIMEASFPPSERRTYDGQAELLANAYYRLMTKENQAGQLIAFLAAWEFQEFRFVEHLATEPSARGGGIGKQLMNELLGQADTPVLLEVELPNTEWAQRRIGFYQRLGFYLNEFNYVQPPLQPGEGPVPLKIMSFPHPLSADEFNHAKAVIHREVYRVDEAMQR